MLTADGLGLIYAALRADLVGGAIAVSDGTQRALVAIATIEQSEEGLTVIATFDEGNANFEWMQREVVSKTGAVIDACEEDQGRKVEGAVWTAQITLTVAADESV